MADRLGDKAKTLFSSGYTPGCLEAALNADKSVPYEKDEDLTRLFDEDAKPNIEFLQKQNSEISERLQNYGNLLYGVEPSRKRKKKDKSNKLLLEREASLLAADEDFEEVLKKQKKKKKNVDEDKDYQDFENLMSIDINSVSNQDLSSIDDITSGETSENSTNIKIQQKTIDSQLDQIKDSRTIFVGNIPNTITKAMLLKQFKQAGKIETLRFRSAAPADLRLDKKVTIIKKKFHENRHNINAYIVFAEETSVEKALQLNGVMLNGMHLRIDSVSQNVKHDLNKSVFIGNLPFGVEEEPIREHFDDCGEIVNVRIIRDKVTGLGKGFGYILFKDSSSIELALLKADTDCCDRKLRVSRCVDSQRYKQESSIKTKKQMKRTPLTDFKKKKMKKKNPRAQERKEFFEGIKTNPNQKIKKPKHAMRRSNENEGKPMIVIDDKIVKKHSGNYTNKKPRTKMPSTKSGFKSNYPSTGHKKSKQTSS